MQSIGHLVVERARQSPDRPFLRFEGRRRSFSEVERSSAQVANRLRELGVGPGDRVGIMLPNGLEYPITWLGVVRLGAVVVPINTGYQAADLRYVLADSGATMVITVSSFVPLLEQVRPDCPTVERIVAWDGSPSFADQVGAASDWHDVAAVGLDRSTLCTLQYTSGTTGFPKGCMAPHGGWLQAAAPFVAMGRFTEADVVLIMTPFYYGDFGWNLVLCLLVGAELAILPRFSASGLWRSARDTGATFFYCLGTMPVLLLKQPPDPAIDRGHRVRWVACSGIPADQQVEIERRWGVPWREWYGTTEIGFVIATALDDTARTGSGSIGRMLPGYEGRLVDGAGREVSPGQVGEFVCRGPEIMTGYWNNPEATAAWRPDGWAHTGDLMYRDSEGYYYLVGRTKDMIRRGGENIAAAEVEAILSEHPSVRNVACISVPDPIRGEEVKAVIEPIGEPPDPAAIVAHCRQRLAAFKVPRYVEFVAGFPLTPSQRIEKHRLSRRTDNCYDAAVTTPAGQ
jgi:crotonobetaine/carnitine-CoA ligase